MANLWLKIKIWTKVILFGLVFLYVLLFAISNYNNKAKLWFFPGKEPELPTLLIVLFAFLGGIVVYFLVRTTFVTMRQVRELKERSRSAKLERAVQDMQNKAAMLRAKPSGTTAPEPEEDETAPPHAS